MTPPTRGERPAPSEPTSQQQAPRPLPPGSEVIEVVAISVKDFEDSLSLQRQSVELSRRNIEIYEDRAGRAAAATERIAAALEDLVGMLRKAWDEEHGNG